MIKKIKGGTYQLIETKGQTKVLILDGVDTYAWVNVVEIGEILVASHNKHLTDCVLALGEYRLYEVKDDADLTDLQHLELHVGEGKWQGYLLTTGLPTEMKKRNRIIPTEELITNSKKDILN